MSRSLNYHNVRSCIKMYGTNNIGKNCWSCRQRVATTFVQIHFSVENRDDIYVYCNFCKPGKYEDKNEVFLTKEEFDRKINMILLL